MVQRVTALYANRSGLIFILHCMQSQQASWREVATRQSGSWERALTCAEGFSGGCAVEGAVALITSRSDEGLNESFCCQEGQL